MHDPSNTIVKHYFYIYTHTHTKKRKKTRAETWFCQSFQAPKTPTRKIRICGRPGKLTFKGHIVWHVDRCMLKNIRRWQQALVSRLGWAAFSVVKRAKLNEKDWYIEPDRARDYNNNNNNNNTDVDLYSIRFRILGISTLCLGLFSRPYACGKWYLFQGLPQVLKGSSCSVDRKPVKRSGFRSRAGLRWRCGPFQFTDGFHSSRKQRLCCSSMRVSHSMGQSAYCHCPATFGWSKMVQQKRGAEDGWSVAFWKFGSALPGG